MQNIMQLRQHVRYFINNAAFPRHGKISAASFEPPLSVKIFNETSLILASIPRSLRVANTPSLCTHEGGGWCGFIHMVLWAMRMDYFVKQLFLCALFKTLIRAPVFLPIFLPPFNQVLTLILVHFFHPSFNLPTNQPPLPSQEVSEVREEKLVAAKRGASMPWVGATIFSHHPIHVCTKYMVVICVL